MRFSWMGGPVIVAALCLVGMTAARAVTPTAGNAATGRAIYNDPAFPLEARVEDALKRLTQDEKLSLLAQQSGGGNASKLDTPPISRLGIPSLRTCDAPEGVRDGQATAFPMGIVMASTWDPALIRQVGQAIGEEGKAKNRQVIYGPCVNVLRTPQGGRGFENYSEDPYLAARMAVNDIEGMQGVGVSACIKHFVCNDQETDRHSINVQVDERTLHEIYLPAFEAGIREAHVWSLMTAFNQVNGTYVSQNTPLLRDMVLTQWGWDGLVISDWGAIHDTVGSVTAGTDLEMPDPSYYKPAALSDALKAGKITQAEIDDMARRVLRAIIRTGLLDGPLKADPSAVNSPAHQRLALKVAQEGITLLKNAGNVLPLNRRTIKSIAVIGPNAQDTQLGGRWSADVQPFYQVSVLDGIKKKTGTQIAVQFAQGCPRTGSASGSSLSDAAALAAKSDVAVVVVGFDNNYEGEELDPPNLYLPGDQDKLIQMVAAANKNTIVVLNQGTPLLMDKWLSRIPGLVEAWYAGQEQGNAIADVLFGDVDPSGKLPETIGARREDYSDFGSYPGKDGVVKYTEGIYVGYRHFDKAHIQPLFPFGYGLSYTTFAYSSLQVPPVLQRGQTGFVHVTVQNTGRVAGDEIVQLYVHDLAPKIDRPVRELKGFRRVSLQPGQKATIAIPLNERSFAYWNVAFHNWKANSGPYEIQVGASSRDIRLRGVLRLQ